MPVLRTLARIWTALLALAALTLGSSLVARWLLPATPWIAAPTLTTSMPVDGDLDVLPRSKVVLNFSVPMNRSSTQYALQISPATEGNFYWSADSRQLTFTPATTLEPDTEYILNIGSTALGRWWQPIVAARTIHFHTAPLPAVIAALPSATGTPVDGSLAIIFSQAMVPADQINLPAALPQLQINPPTSTQQRWLSQNTLLIQPDTPLRAATHYTATITADLTDLRGVDLGQPFSWNWSTAWPEPRGFTPSANAHWVSPHQPLVLTLSSPVDEALLRSTLSINPPTEGNLSTALIGASQVVTFTPQLGWEYGRSYQVHLATSDPSLAAPPTLIWQFSVEPKPGLLAFFPGQGQSLQAGQEVRLIFSTPMDEASLRSGLKIEPPVNDLPLQVNETEVRLRPDLQPSTTYTLTIAADTPDRSGEPLGITPTVQLRAASAEPALRIPPTSAHVISLPVKQTARIALERINLTRLDLSLYKLDTPTVVRAMSLKPNEWRDFSPERYGQSLSRSWSLPLSDPTDTLVRDPITVEIADNTSLPPGIYYLRVISHEGPRADLLLQVSSVVLTLRQSDSQVLVWATDKVSGAPVTDLPIRLYAGEALITRGQTGPDGIWEQPIQRPDGSAPYVVLTDDSSPALVRSDWLAAPKNDHTPQTRSLIFLNQPSYVPDDSVHIGGIARQFASDGSLILPDAHTTCRMLFEAGGSTTLSQNTACLIDTSGIVSGTMRLPPHQPPGDYHLQVQVGDSTTALTVHVAADTSPNRLSFSEAGGQLHIRADQAGLPLSGATISWTLHLEPLATPSNTDGFAFGADLPPPEQIDGSGITDPGGQLVVPLPNGKFTGTLLHYQIRAELRIADELLAIGQHEGDSFPTDSRVGLRLPSRIVQSNERASVELLTLNANSSPAPNKPMNVSVYRSGNLDGTPLIVRKATSDTQGRATVQLVQLRPGAYTIVAKTGDSTSSTELWVAGGRYTGWQNAPGQVGVVADRDSYRPGDVARLLVTTPYAKAHLLLTTERGKLHSAEVRDIQASQLITLTITPEMAPAISIGAVIAAGSERLVGATAIRVADNQPILDLEITSDSPHYAPDSTALLHITTSLAGVPTPATLMVTLDPAGSASGDPALARFIPPLPNPLETAMLQIHQQPPMDSRNIPNNRLTLSGAVGHMLVQTEVDGQAVLRVPLPNSSGSWRISTYAIAGTGHLATASITVTTRLPLDLTPDAPPILRPDDQSEVGLLVNNTSTITQSLKLRLQATGGTINQSTPPERTLILAPGEAQRIAWMVSPRPEASAVNLRFTASGADLNNHETRLLPVEAAPLAATQ
ncbi:MAG: hypothetical protein HGA19_12000, partial [Oscillochloris sp.]|nr:hypothetical protein [Oscillochloris sp.]